MKGMDDNDEKMDDNKKELWLQKERKTRGGCIFIHP
jgi:hypothetical protein